MNDEWYTKHFGCPESYADPIRQYELCKARGMTLVTLTDHDTIAGGLRLIDRPDFFVSEEVTTQFPENGCVMHVLVWNITVAEHEEIQRRRQDIYELSGYLRARRLAHALAHPLLSSNWRLDAVTFEKALVLFPVLEAINGLMDRRTDPSMAHLLKSLTPRVLDDLAAKHGLTLPDRGAHFPALSAGSDDHVHRRCGTGFTEVAGQHGIAAFLERVMDGQGRPMGTTADLNRMAACAKHTTYEHLRRECGTHPGANPLLDVMNAVAGHAPGLTGAAMGPARVLLSSLAGAVRKAAIEPHPALDILHTPEPPSDEADEMLVSAVTRTSDALLAKACASLADSVLGFDLYGMLAALPDVLGGLSVVTPLLFAADHLARQELQVRRLWREWTAFPPPVLEEAMAIFSDSLDNIDGVAAWCGRFEQQASRAGRRVWFADCGKAGTPPVRDAAKADLPVVGRFSLPFYPGFNIAIPSFAATVERMWRERITHVEVSTPGPMGLAGLAAARLLRLPVTASYHTDLPDLVGTLSGEPAFASLVRRYLGWFYRAVDHVFAFAPASREKLIAMGVPAEKITLMPMAVDPEDFSPAKSSDTAFASQGIDASDRPIVLSVGRLSEEKNLPLVVAAVEKLQDRANPPLLLVVGDGPARVDLQLQCKDKEFVVFLGFKQGEILRQLYASARLFVFASRVDTMGLVNLEALASGLPILVPADAAIADSLAHGETALFYQPEAGHLARAIAQVLDDPECARRLAEGGRRHTLARWQQADFEHVWDMMLRAPGVRPPS